MFIPNLIPYPNTTKNILISRVHNKLLMNRFVQRFILIDVNLAEMFPDPWEKVHALSRRKERELSSHGHPTSTHWIRPWIGLPQPGSLRWPGMMQTGLGMVILFIKWIRIIVRLCAGEHRVTWAGIGRWSNGEHVIGEARVAVVTLTEMVTAAMVPKVVMTILLTLNTSSAAAARGHLAEISTAIAVTETSSKWV